jgi:hypothetical protein
VGRGRTALCEGDRDSQDELRRRPSIHVNEHSKLSINVPKYRPIGGGRVARVVGDRDKKNKSRRGPPSHVVEYR